MGSISESGALLGSVQQFVLWIDGRMFTTTHMLWGEPCERGFFKVQRYWDGAVGMQLIKVRSYGVSW